MKRYVVRSPVKERLVVEVPEQPEDIAHELVKYTTTTSQTLSLGTPATTTLIDFDTLVFDEAERVTTGASWVFTAGVDGWYQVIVNVGVDATTGIVGCELLLYKNGNPVRTLHRGHNFSGDNLGQLHGVAIEQLVAGDTLAVYVKDNEGGPLELSTDSKANFIEILRVL